MTIVSGGGMSYGWDELDPAPLGRPDEWVHPGLAATDGGGVRGFDQSTGELVDLDADGRVVRRRWTEVLCGHGITIDATGRTWIADPGRRARLVDGAVVSEERRGRVAVVDQDGGIAMDLDVLQLAVYRARPFRPTSIAIERPDDPDSAIWVADGYGAGVVSRWSPGGRLLASIETAPPVERFDCPHAVTIDDRGSEPALLIADRGNALVHRFDLDGRHLASLGRDALTTPSAMALSGDALLVAELNGRIAVVGPDDRIAGYLGDGSDARDEEGWPNRRDRDRTVRREPFVAGRFVSPHAFTILRDGRVLVAEWRIGGRLVRLTPIPVGLGQA